MPRPRSRRRLAGPPVRHREQTSAGGLVIDVARAALIARYGPEGRLPWSLPKGHVEGEQTIEEAAVRQRPHRLAHADERRLVRLVPGLLADVT